MNNYFLYDNYFLSMIDAEDSPSDRAMFETNSLWLRDVISVSPVGV